jgi:hypothetical protein
MKKYANMSGEFGELFTKQVREKLISVLKADEPDITENEIERILSSAFIGYTDEEIEKLLTAQKVEYLPNIYRQYLQVMGHQAGGILFQGGDKSYRQLQASKQAIRRVLEEVPDSPALPPDVFIFLSYQGVDFFLFVAEKSNDDPPVYYYGEGDITFLKVSDYLSTWFFTQAADLLRYPSSQKASTDKGDLPF